MATIARHGGPYIWVTWITGLLASDDQCRWAPWFKAHYRYDKVERPDSALTKWKAEHGAMVEGRVRELTADGWLVFVEGQNKFTIEGKAATLAGTPDIVARRSDDVLVVDCKSGQRRAKDFWQVCIYLFVLPLSHEACQDEGVRIVGEVQYRDGSIVIEPEEFTPDIRQAIARQIAETGSTAPPQKIASARECQFCDISSSDCPARIDREKRQVAHGLF